MTRLDRSSAPLFDAEADPYADADPGFSFFDWILHADVGVHNAHVLRTRYRRRIHLPMRETPRPCARDLTAHRSDPRMH